VVKSKTTKKAGKTRAKPQRRSARPARQKAAGPTLTYRERQKLLMRRVRASEQGITIRPCLNPRRRRTCEKDVYRWLATYLGHKFSNPFTKHHKAMINAILHRARHGGDQAIAAPRGEGKTSIVEGVILFCVLVGLLRFPVLVGATKDAGLEILDSIKYELEHNELLAADYPEVCDPIWALEGESRRAKKQNVEGVFTQIIWQKYLVKLPKIEGSKAGGAIIAARGLNGRIRGTKRIVERPDFSLIDDPETDTSARNPKTTTKLMQKLDRDIAGLAGQGKTIARVVLVTIQVAGCLADRLTNPSICPTYNGMRFPLVEKMPERDDLVQEYIRLFKAGQSKGDEDGREALKFYVINRKEIERGAKLANKHRLIKKPGKDGKPLEISALQHALNWIARVGWDNFRAEFQNDPPADSLPETLGITAELVASRQNHYPRFQVPSETYFLGAALDLGKTRFHASTTAWIPGRAGLFVDYQSFDVLGVEGAHHDDAIKKAIYNALVHWRAELLDSPYFNTRGEVRAVDLAVIDAGDWHDVVYKFIRDVGGLPFVASKGFGDGPGRSPWSAGKESKHRIVGNHWWISYQPEHEIWLYGFDADYWKLQVHQGFLTPTLHDDQTVREMSLSLFAQDQLHQHLPFANEVTAEEWREQFVPDVGWKKKWIKIRKANHRLDNATNAAFIHDVWLNRMAGQSQPPAQPISQPAPDEPRNVFRTPSGMPYLISERT
jgi:hypothetical protein